MRRSAPCSLAFSKSPTTTIPDGVSGQFQGEAKAFQSSLGNLAVLLVVAIMVVYIVLGILYESYIHPLTILSGLPSAGFGALVTLLLFRMDLNIYAFVGMIMLIGIVEKNAIMQIDFALEAERSGMSPEKAIYQGCLIRFRPIMMTTMAAMLGAVPIALGKGAGGEARQPLGMVVVGGSDLLATRDAVSDAGGLHVHGAGAELVPVASRVERASDRCASIGRGHPLGCPEDTRTRGTFPLTTFVTFVPSWRSQNAIYRIRNPDWTGPTAISLVSR